MAVQLKDAQIRVKLELGDATDTVESLEKRTEKQREEAAKDERKERKRERTEKAKQKRGGVGTAVAAGGLAAIMRRVLGSVGLLAAAGIGIAEFGQHFGPIAEPAMREMIARIFGVPVGELGLLSDFGESWRKIKLQVSSIGTAGAEAVEMASAVVLSGGTVTPEMATLFFETSRRVAILEANLAAASKRAKQTAAGQAVGEVIGAALAGVSGGDKKAAPGAGLKGGGTFILPGRFDQMKRQLDPESFRQGSGR